MKVVKLSSLRSIKDVRTAVAAAKSAGQSAVYLADTSLNVNHVIMTIDDYEKLLSQIQKEDV